MSATTDAVDSGREASHGLTASQLHHRRCFACGSENPAGLHLSFAPVGDGEVQCSFVAPAELQGYARVLQGGIVATLLDSAMTNLLLQRNIVARTAEMQIRFRHPVPVARKICVRGKLELSHGCLHILSASIVRRGKILAEARAKFMSVRQVRFEARPSCPPGNAQRKRGKGKQ